MNHTEQCANICQSMINSLHDPFFALDINYCYLKFNKAHADIIKLLYGKDIELGRCIYDYLQVTEDAEKSKTNIDRAFNGECFTEYSFSGQKENMKYFENVYNPIYDIGNCIIGVFVLSKDYSVMMEAHNHTALMEHRYQNVFDNVNDAIFLLNKNTGQILEANKAAEKLYGYTKSEFVLLKNIDLSAEPDKTFSALKTELNHAPVRYHKKKNGIVFPVEITAGFFEQNDQSLCVVDIRDISKRLKNESIILEKNKELEQMIYITSHDLRTPLINIKGYANELKFALAEINKEITLNPELAEKLSLVLNEEIPESFSYIDNSCEKMNSLINGLLKISKLGKVELNYKSLNMTKLCSTISALYSHLLNEKNISIEIEPLPDCVADESLINQVMCNILNNSIKFSKNDAQGEIKISGICENGYANYCVADNGIGIPKEQEGKIFMLFNKLNPNIKGEGLGLAIASKIIERHNGKIWADSEDGNGSKIFFQIPV